MKIRSLEQLVDFTSNEISWRRKELLDLKFLVQTHKATDKVDTYIRSGVTLLYSHWEGFVKATGTAYLCYISMGRHTYKNLKPNLIALSIKDKLNLASESKKSETHNKVAEFFVYGMEDRSSIPWENVINTKSNLNSDVLEDIVNTLGLDFSPYETKRKFLDEKLLKSRNEIAHGKHLLVSFESYQEFHKEVSELLDLFRNQIDNAAVTKSFMR